MQVMQGLPEVRVDDLVEARYPLERGREAVAHAWRPEALKVLLSM